jgi:hypothetical protein
MAGVYNTTNRRDNVKSNRKSDDREEIAMSNLGIGSLSSNATQTILC